MNGCDTSKACGPYGIPARLLKECSEQIASSLFEIFNQSLSGGQIPPRRNPQTWQLFTRKTKKKLAKNYRPISLLQIVCKVLEQCAFNRFLSSLMTQSPLYNTQLLSVLHTMRQNLDKNIQMDVFYLDFAKAFDTVYHLNQQE